MGWEHWRTSLREIWNRWASLSVRCMCSNYSQWVTYWSAVLEKLEDVLMGWTSAPLVSNPLAESAQCFDIILASSGHGLCSCSRSLFRTDRTFDTESDSGYMSAPSTNSPELLYDHAIFRFRGSSRGDHLEQGCSNYHWDSKAWYR